MSRGIGTWHSQLSSHHFCTASNSTQRQFSLPAMTFFMQLLPHCPLLNTALGEEEGGRKEFPMKKIQIENVKLKVFPKHFEIFSLLNALIYQDSCPSCLPSFLFQLKKWPGEESDKILEIKEKLLSILKSHDKFLWLNHCKHKRKLFFFSSSFRNASFSFFQNKSSSFDQNK